MVDAAADVFPKYRQHAGTFAGQIADTVTVFRGMLAQLQAGFINHWDETGKFLGIVVGGDERTTTSGLLGATGDSIPPEARVDTSGAILEHLSGVAGAPSQATVGNLVFSATSNIDDLTMTDTTNPPVGVLWRFKSATDVDVKLFTPGEFEAGIASGTWLI